MIREGRESLKCLTTSCPLGLKFTQLLHLYIARRRGLGRAQKLPTVPAQRHFQRIRNEQRAATTTKKVLTKRYRKRFRLATGSCNEGLAKLDPSRTMMDTSTEMVFILFQASCRLKKKSEVLRRSMTVFFATDQTIIDHRQLTPQSRWRSGTERYRGWPSQRRCSPCRSWQGGRASAQPTRIAPASRLGP